MKKPKQSKTPYKELCKIHRGVFLNFIDVYVEKIEPGTYTALLRLYDNKVTIENISILYHAKMPAFWDALLDDKLITIQHKPCFTIKSSTTNN